MRVTQLGVSNTTYSTVNTNTNGSEGKINNVKEEKKLIFFRKKWKTINAGFGMCLIREYQRGLRHTMSIPKVGEDVRLVFWAMAAATNTSSVSAE